MKKYLLLLLFAFSLFACAIDQANTPRLELKTIFFNDKEEDYSRKLNEILPLCQGDSIKVSFSLNGNGTDLSTFIVKSESENIAFVTYPRDPDEISDELNIEGTLRYKDGVRKTSVAVRLTVLEARDEEFKLSFYLNSKASPESEGALYSLDLKTTMQPREEDQKKDVSN